MRSLLMLVSLAAGCASSSSGNPGSGPGDGGGGGPADTPLVSGLAISEISVNQAVKIPIALGSSAVVERVAPVVAGRRGLIRVAVQPDSSWQPREIVARLELSSGAGPSQPSEVKAVISGPSTDADLGSTLNFDLPGEVFTPDLSFAVSLREVTQASTGAASPGARYPSEGQTPMGVHSTGAALHMVLVPFRYDVDGSGRLPDLSEQQITLYKNQMLAMYPTPSIEVRIHDPIPWSQPIEPNGNGWTGVLENLLFRRQQDRNNNQAAANEYYYGLFSPEPNFVSYCSKSPVCILGLSSGLPDPAEEYVRGSVGVGFTGDYAAGTFAHETGHAHGRLHAPCAPGGFIQQKDPDYPYPDGQIGAWGLNPLTQEAFDPAGKVRDFMGYCDPSWISDYTYGALADRMTFVSSSADVVGGPGSGAQYRVIISDGQSDLRLGSSVQLRHAPRGDSRQLEALDASGRVLRQVEGRFLPFDHLPGGLILVREPNAEEKALRMQGRTLRL